jgi:hypothetical protein
MEVGDYCTYKFFGFLALKKVETQGELIRQKAHKETHLLQTFANMTATLSNTSGSRHEKKGTEFKKRGVELKHKPMCKLCDEQHRWIYSHITEVSVDSAGQVSQARAEV